MQHATQFKIQSSRLNVRSVVPSTDGHHTALVWICEESYLLASFFRTEAVSCAVDKQSSLVQYHLQSLYRLIFPSERLYVLTTEAAHSATVNNDGHYVHAIEFNNDIMPLADNEILPYDYDNVSIMSQSILSYSHYQLHL